MTFPQKSYRYSERRLNGLAASPAWIKLLADEAGRRDRGLVQYNCVHGYHLESRPHGQWKLHNPFELQLSFDDLQVGLRTVYFSSTDALNWTGVYDGMTISLHFFREELVQLVAPEPCPPPVVMPWDKVAPDDLPPSSPPPPSPHSLDDEDGEALNDAAYEVYDGIDTD